MSNKPITPRLKDGLKQEEWENLQPELKEFYTEFSTTFGYTPVVTSGARTQVFKTKNSHHLSGGAMDLRYDQKLVNDLYNTREGLGILTKYNLGMLDESTPEALAKTGGSGSHIHVGFDSSLAKKAREKYQSFGEEMENISTNQPNNSTFEIHQGATAPEGTWDQFLKDFKKEKQKEDKVESSEARQEIEKQKEQISKEQQFLQAFTQATQPLSEDVQQRESTIARPEFQPNPINVQEGLPELPTLFQFKEGGTLIANTPEEQQIGLTGAPKGTTGIFNYPSAEERQFVRTDRDLRLFADGLEIGKLTKDNPTINVPPAFQITEQEFQDGGELNKKEQKEITFKATMDWLNSNPYTVDGKPIPINKLHPTTPTPGQYPRMTGDNLEISGVGRYAPGEYIPVPTPEDYKGLPIYSVNDKYIVIDKDFNKEYLNYYEDKKLLGKDVLYPIYGVGRPYKQ